MADPELGFGNCEEVKFYVLPFRMQDSTNWCGMRKHSTSLIKPLGKEQLSINCTSGIYKHASLDREMKQNKRRKTGSWLCETNPKTKDTKPNKRRKRGEEDRTNSMQGRRNDKMTDGCGRQHHKLRTAEKQNRHKNKNQGRSLQSRNARCGRW